MNSASSQIGRTTVFVLMLATIFPAQLLAQAGATDRLRFQQQATFGFTPTLDSTIQTSGIEAYLGQQFNLPRSPQFPFPDVQLQYFSPSPLCNGTADADIDPVDPPDSPINCFRDTYTVAANGSISPASSLYPMKTWFFREAMYSERQLRLRVAWALSQIWVVSGNEIPQSRHMLEYFKILYEEALGTPGVHDSDYFKLMDRMTLNPAMGDYLDMATSTKASPNENYARELLQLFTTGTYRLCIDGKYLTTSLPPVDPCQPNPPTGLKVPVYSQQTIENFARTFTGWTYCNVPSTTCKSARVGTTNYIDPIELNPANHNLDSKTLLAGSQEQSVSPCPFCDPVTDPATIRTYAESSRQQALRNVFYHPNVAPFVSRLLIQHLVRSDPSPAYIQRVAEKFENHDGTRNGIRGDMKTVVRAILTDPEARGDSTDQYENYGKLKEPVNYALNIMRAFRVSGPVGGQSTGEAFIDPWFGKMAQNPFHSPSVFNYYSPKNTIGGGLLAPEFAVMTQTTSLARLNFAKQLIFEGFPAGGPSYNTTLDLSDLTSLSDFNLVEELSRRLMHSQMSEATKGRIKHRLLTLPPGNALLRVKEAVFLAVSSAEFQTQR